MSVSVSYVFALMSTLVTRKKHATKHNISLVRQEDIKMSALESKIKYTISKQSVSIMSKNCLRNFHCNEEIVVIHLIFIQTNKGQNNFRTFVAMRN